MSSGILAGESSSTDSTPMAVIILLQRYTTSKHAGHYAAAHPWEMFLQHFTVRAFVVILSLLHVSTTHPCYIRLSVHYTCFCRCNMSLQHDSLCLAAFRLLRTKEKFILSGYFLGHGIMCKWNDIPYSH